MNERRDGDYFGVFDVADWLWAYRLLGGVAVVVGLAGAIGAWNLGGAGGERYSVVFAIYTSGTPVRSETDLVDILAAHLASAEAEIPSKANPLYTTYDSAEDAENAIEVAQDLEDRLVAEVQARLEETAPITRYNEAALAINLNAATFLKAQKSGLITLFIPQMEPVPASRSLRAPILVFVLSLMLALVIAGSHSFWTAWRTRRHARDKQTE